VILEGIVTTLSSDGLLNIAPMGPSVDHQPGFEFDRFVLRPFRTSVTYRNLKERGAGVLHVTDDVLLLAQTAIGAAVEPVPETRPAEAVLGRILVNACRYYEFRVRSVEDSTDRTTIEVETVARGRLRDCFGFNRAKHAVVEAAILATRIGLIPAAAIQEEFRKFQIVVDKTGGPDEHAAFSLLQQFLDAAAHTLAADSEAPRS
jgi:hypothetical protein